MAATILSINAWFEKINQHDLIIDVRSPMEYAHAHIPDAINLPLFSDEQRKIIGTTYKQQSRQAAIKIGLDFFGVKMKTLVNEAESLLHDKPNKKIFLHCWRGGMRSNAVAWLLDLYGFDVYLLKGGYKAYRNWVLQQFEKKYPIKIIGGKTGSGKTLLIQYLKQSNCAAIDLEALAHHKGSSFGALGELAQPTQEQFENNLAFAVSQVSSNSLFLEDESQRIGCVNIPKSFWLQMRRADVLYMDVNFEERLKWIIEQYGKFDIEKLKEATNRIRKKLGGLILKQIIENLDVNNVEAAFRLLLDYYDREYEKAYNKREDLKCTKFYFEKMEIEKMATIIKQ